MAPKEIEAFDARVQFIRPEPWKPSWINPTQRYAFDNPLYGRLKPTVSVAQAQAEAAGIERNYYNAAPDWNKTILDRASYRIVVSRLQDARIASVRSSLYLLQGGVVFVLLIGCVNVANLLLSRANVRQGELSIRLAIGATRAAIARQLFVESLTITFLGAGLGVGGAFGAIHTINRYSQATLPGMQPFAIELRVLVFTVVLTATVGLLIGVLPMVHVLRPKLTSLTPHSSRTASGSRSLRVLSGALVTCQVSVTLILLVGAGLLIHSFANAVAVKPGFDPDNLVTARIALGRPYWNDHGAEFQLQLVRSLETIPGVESAALGEGVPFQGGVDVSVLTLKDSPLPAGSIQPNAYEIGISTGYFRTMKIRLLEGRFYNDHDLDGVDYIVDERFAKKYFPGRSAIGAHFTFQNRHLPAKAEDWPVIVGVVQNVPHNGVEDRTNTPFTYYPLLKAQPEQPYLFVRSSRPLADIVGAIRETLHRLDPAVPLYDIKSARTAIEDSFYSRRAVMLLLGGFAGLALFLSAIGVYGTIAYDVSQRTREIGIRSAIGATRWQIVSLVMREGLSRTSIGLFVGVALAVGLSRLMAAMLFEVKPTDSWTYIEVSALLAIVAAVATYLPARRAALANPVQALRME